MRIIKNKHLINGDLLVIVPSRGRPHRLADMMDSFYKTSSGKTSLLICIDNDDPYLGDYIKLLKGTSYSIAKRRYITHIFNDIFALYPDFKYYSCSNDDFLYKTPDWDIMLMTDGIGYGNDGYHGEDVPVTSVINGDIPRALGWLQMPTLKHLCGDLVWYEIGKSINRLHYFSSVSIEHKHFYIEPEYEDETYLYTNSEEMYRHDKIQYVLWHTQKREEDIERIKEGINEHNASK